MVLLVSIPMDESFSLPPTVPMGQGSDLEKNHALGLLIAHRNLQPAANLAYFVGLGDVRAVVSDQRDSSMNGTATSKTERPPCARVG